MLHRRRCEITSRSSLVGENAKPVLYHLKGALVSGSTWTLIIENRANTQSGLWDGMGAAA